MVRKELESELENINWNVIGLRKLRRRGEGWMILKSGNILLHKGREDESFFEVGFIISNNIQGKS